MAKNENKLEALDDASWALAAALLASGQKDYGAKIETVDGEQIVVIVWKAGKREG